jgi:hypothetical protein
MKGHDMNTGANSVGELLLLKPALRFENINGTPRMNAKPKDYPCSPEQAVINRLTDRLEEALARLARLALLEEPQQPDDPDQYMLDYHWDELSTSSMQSGKNRIDSAA